MKKHLEKSKRSIQIALLTTTLLTGTSLLANDNSLTSAGEKELTKLNIIYDYDEVFGFDIEEYLSQKAPHLLPYAEAISHFSGESTISPRVFIALMEQQSGLLSGRDFIESDLAQPFGVMSQQYGFIEQLRDISDRLSQAYYKGHSYAETGKNQKFTTDADARKAIQSIFSYGFPTTELQPGSKEQIEHFSSVFFELFPEEANSKKQLAPAATKLVPATNFLQFPFKRNERWYVSGSHTTSGSGSWPQSSIDFHNGGYWGSDTSNKWVAASASGRVKVYSSCNMEIFHSDGWSTKYYHLSNIYYRNNDYTYKNYGIANYASNKNQALCEGGHSTGPHLHWSLKLNGQYYHLNNVTLSGYKIHTGRDSYDTNCNYFYLIKNGRKYCAGYYTNYGSTRMSESAGDNLNQSETPILNSKMFSQEEKF